MRFLWVAGVYWTAGTLFACIPIQLAYDYYQGVEEGLGSSPEASLISFLIREFPAFPIAILGLSAASTCFFAGLYTRYHFMNTTKNKEAKRLNNWITFFGSLMTASLVAVAANPMVDEGLVFHFIPAGVCFISSAVCCILDFKMSTILYTHKERITASESRCSLLSRYGCVLCGIGICTSYISWLFDIPKGLWKNESIDWIFPIFEYVSLAGMLAYICESAKRSTEYEITLTFKKYRQKTAVTRTIPEDDRVFFSPTRSTLKSTGRILACVVVLVSVLVYAYIECPHVPPQQSTIGVYISGGSGRIARKLIDRYVETYDQVNLALGGRNITKLKMLETELSAYENVKVFAEKADVSDQVDLLSFIYRIPFNIDHVLANAAVVTNDGSLSARVNVLGIVNTVELCEKVFPKLHFVIFSSLAGSVPLPGKEGHLAASKAFTNFYGLTLANEFANDPNYTATTIAFGFIRHKSGWFTYDFESGSHVLFRAIHSKRSFITTHPILVFLQYFHGIIPYRILHWIYTL